MADGAPDLDDRRGASRVSRHVNMLMVDCDILNVRYACNMSKTLGIRAERPSTVSTVTVLVDEDLRQRLACSAERNERSMGAEVRVALKQHLGPADGEEVTHE
jgi:hypothetical protein